MTPVPDQLSLKSRSSQFPEGNVSFTKPTPMSVPPFIIAVVFLLGPPQEAKVSQQLLTVQKGVASYYSHKFNGKKTAFGEIFNNRLYTAAHPTLPHNTLLEVTNIANNKKVVVRINDRGPFGKHRRLLDISHAAAAELDLLRKGIGQVEIKVVGTEGRLFSELDGLTRLAELLAPLQTAPQP